MIEAVWNPKQKKIWCAYTMDELRRMARAERASPVVVPIIGHPTGGARIEIFTTRLEMAGAGQVLWWDHPHASRVGAVSPGTLYVILDTLRFRALCKIDEAMAQGIRFLSNPIFGLNVRGSHLLWTLYDDQWHNCSFGETNARMTNAVRKWRQARAARKNPLLEKVSLTMTPISDNHGG